MKPAYQSFLEKSLQQAALQATEAALSSNSTVQSNGRLKHSWLQTSLQWMFWLCDKMNMDIYKVLWSDKCCDSVSTGNLNYMLQGKTNVTNHLSAWKLSSS